MSTRSHLGVLLVNVPIQLQAVWDEIPDAGCKGLCADACGPVGASPVEIALIEARGVNLEDPANALLDVVMGHEAKDCPALVDGRCSVYDIRPTICRLYGSAEPLQCEHGCVPVGGLLTPEQSHRILNRSLQVGQASSRAERRRR